MNNIAKRGFGSMPRDRQREIARMGGKAAHEQGTAHRWNEREARAAGRKGAAVRAVRRLRARDPHAGGTS